MLHLRTQAEPDGIACVLHGVSGGRERTMPSNVIAAKKVQGTPVTNPQGENLGEIEDVVIDKLDGMVRYAVLSFGGFLGMGDKLFALPWEVLEYNEGQGAYVISIDKETLQNAP